MGAVGGMERITSIIRANLMLLMQILYRHILFHCFARHSAG